MKKYIILYDITDDKRLRRVAKTLESYGKRVQKSVFEIEANERTLNYLRSIINRIIIEKDIVCYFDVCEKDWQKKEKYGPEKFDDENEAEYYIL